MICFVMFFCCKQKTAYEMRISDWSSDVCSSDLKAASAKAASAKAVGGRVLIFDTTLRDGEQSPGCSMNLEEKLQVAQILEEMGVDVIEAGFPIASQDRKSVGEGKSVSDSVELGGRRIVKKKRIEDNGCET